MSNIFKLVLAIALIAGLAFQTFMGLETYFDHVVIWTGATSLACLLIMED